MIAPVIILIGFAAFGIGILLYLWFTQPHKGDRIAPKPSKRKTPRTYPLGGAIGALLGRTPAPAADATLTGDAPDGLAQMSLAERIEAIPLPIPGDAHSYAEYLRQVTQTTSTETGREGTSSWDPDAIALLSEVVADEPELAGVLAAIDAAQVQDEASEQAVQLFRDAHADEIEAAGDTTEQDRRSYEEAGR